MSSLRDNQTVQKAEIRVKLTTAGIILVTPPALYLTHQYAALAGYITACVAVMFWWLILSPHAVRRNRVLALRRRIRMRLRPGAGYASLAELGIRWSRIAAVYHGKRARPGMSWRARACSPATQYAVRLGRAQYGRRVFARMEDQVLVLAPPRTGKSGLLADRICDHPGGVVATSTRPDLSQATREDRARLGRIEVFNPQQVGHVVSTMRFDLLGPCRDMVMAFRMATWLSGGAGGPAQGNLEWFAAKGEVALAGLLFAAAISGATITDVYRWVQREDAEVPLKTIAEYGTPEMLAVVRHMLEDNRTSGSVRETIDLVLKWAALPQLAEAVTRRPGQPMLDVAELALRHGTLYLIGSGDENSPLTPLFRALTSYIHYEAGIIGTRQPSGRLDPPLFMALDEVTQICPIDLPGMLADSAGKGILIQPVVHSVAQLEDRYGQAAARTIWATCGTKIFLPGTTDPETLHNVAELLGTVHDGDRHIDLCPPALLRTLPNWRALVISVNRDPVIVRIRPVWKRMDRRFPGRYLARRAAPAALPESVDVPAVTRVMDLIETVTDTTADGDLVRVPGPRENTRAWPNTSHYDPHNQ
jgi:type IV secretion system protein VirD4